MSVDLRVDWCSYQAAKYAVEHWHYSKTMPLPPVASLGVWEDKRFIGAILFSHGSSGVHHIGKGFGLSSVNVAELGRIALTQHKTHVSKLVSLALVMVKKTYPRLRLIVSYADPEQGHIGRIYQAGNWVYVGRSAPDKAYVDKFGKRYHSRRISSTGYKINFGRKTACPPMSELSEIPVLPKYKYLYPLDRAMRKQIAPLAKPYPKRETCGPSVEGDTLPQAESDVRSIGAAPVLTTVASR